MFKRLFGLDRNPYQHHLDLLMKVRLIPYGSTDDLKRGGVPDRRRTTQCALLILMVLLNVTRFVVLVIDGGHPLVGE